MQKFGSFILIALIIFVTLISIIYDPLPAAKALTLPIIPFGGRVLAMIPCTCPTDIGKFIIAIGPPRPGIFMYDFRFAWLTLKLFYRLVIGNKVLGYAEAFAPGVCWMFVPTLPPSCAPVAIFPYIFVVGTTAIPPP